ncbi:dihydroxy-acid dehydratase ilv3 [Lecanora helva]
MFLHTLRKQWARPSSLHVNPLATIRTISTTVRRKADSSSSKLNQVSQHVTQPKSQGASQAMLYATGLEPSDMSKAQVGISSVWYSGNPCNMHLLDLNHRVKEGVERQGLIGYQFNTVGVSDAISMGTKGMRYSLQSRDLIADSIETVMGGQWYDANISIPGCDKNMPGVVMAMGRVNRPSIMVYGGTIKPGCAATQNNADIDIISAFQSYGQFIAGDINEEQRFDIIRNACPGGGACGGMYTANTMATAIEVMGMTLPGSSSNPAESKAKQLECLAAGGAIKKLLEEDIRPSDILTREAFENAMIVVNITGGSTNAVLHLIAIAHSVGINLTIDDFQKVSDRTPFLADLKPSGKYVMADLHNIGGTPALLKFLLKEGVITGKGMTVTGQTLSKNLETAPDFPSDQTIIRPFSNPIKETGHIQILCGSLAPGGCVGKITGKEGLRFAGKARVFNDEDDMVSALEQGSIKKGEKTVVVIRYEGPKGGPGMPEMLKPSSAIMGAGLGKDVALLTDGRFSGGSHGFLIGHIVPEAQEGGPIALVRDGDEVVIDTETKRLDLVVEEREMERRRKEWQKPGLKYQKGTLKKYASLRITKPTPSPTNAKPTNSTSAPTQLPNENTSSHDIIAIALLDTAIADTSANFTKAMGYESFYVAGFKVTLERLEGGGAIGETQTQMRDDRCCWFGGLLRPVLDLRRGKVRRGNFLLLEKQEKCPNVASITSEKV